MINSREDIFGKTTAAKNSLHISVVTSGEIMILKDITGC